MIAVKILVHVITNAISIYIDELIKFIIPTADDSIKLHDEQNQFE